MREVIDICGKPWNMFSHDASRSVDATLCDIEAVTGDLIGSDGIHGHRRKERGTHYRAATNDECCQLELYINVKKSIDIRRPIPGSVSRWLRSVAARLIEAANGLATVEDKRDRKLLRRYVAGDTSVAFDKDSWEFVEVEPAAA